MLKNDVSIVKEKIISFKLVLIILDKLFTGKKPPDEIKVIDKLNESKVLMLINFKTTKMKRVSNV